MFAKMRKSFIFTVIILFVFLGIFPNTAHAKVLDEIQDYTLTVNMRTDGTMDIHYHIEWKVLDDTSEGPLEWVKIGIPNHHVDEIKSQSDIIESIKYSSDGGDYVEIYFNKKYYENEIVTFDFSIHQSHMYVIEKEDNLLRYSFTPGWFDDIQVKDITIKWNKTNVIKSNSAESDGNYIIWNGSLDFGERLNASVSYNLDAFEATEEGQVEEENGNWIGFVLLLILLFLLVVVIIYAFISDDYDSHGGFGGRTSYHSTHIHHSSSSRSSCACVRSCACACACAGGGRAGCSKKDFYKTNVRVNILKQVLEEDE